MKVSKEHVIIKTLQNNGNQIVTMAKTHIKGFWSAAYSCAAMRAKENKGQGTTEYAIIVGVIVVIAIIAMVAFRDKIQSLWDGIANAINSL